MSKLRQGERHRIKRSRWFRNNLTMASNMSWIRIFQFPGGRDISRLEAKSCGFSVTNEYETINSWQKIIQHLLFILALIKKPAGRQFTQEGKVCNPLPPDNEKGSISHIDDDKNRPLPSLQWLFLSRKHGQKEEQALQYHHTDVGIAFYLEWQRLDRWTYAQ